MTINSQALQQVGQGTAEKVNLNSDDCICRKVAVTVRTWRDVTCIVRSTATSSSDRKAGGMQQSDFM